MRFSDVKVERLVKYRLDFYWQPCIFLSSNDSVLSKEKSLIFYLTWVICIQRIYGKKKHLNVGIFIGLKRLASAPFISEDQHLSQDLYIDSNYRK